MASSGSHDRSTSGAATTTGDLARIDLPMGARNMELVWHVVLPT